MHKQGTAFNYNGRAQRHAQGLDRFQSSMAVAKCLLSRSSAPKGGMVGKAICRATTKSSSLKWKVSSQRNFSQDFRGATQSLSPVRVHRTRGVVTYRNAPCLKLSVRQRKRSFVLSNNPLLALGAYATPFLSSLPGVFRLSGR